VNGQAVVFNEPVTAPYVWIMSAITVLLAEDHALVREGMRDLLDREADLHVVGEAENGKQAVDKAASLCPDVVLMDVDMPVLDGIEATRQIKAKHPATTVLVLSAYDDDQYVFAVLDAGAAGYLLKNVRGPQLVEAIRSVHAGESVLHPIVARKVVNRFIGAESGEMRSHSGEPLSERELEILRLAACGMSNRDIADKLVLSARTVQAHLANIFDKLTVGSRTEAVVHALKRGWFSLEDLEI
jgi:DNA-binding NarL/FixJ family response regulator